MGRQYNNIILIVSGGGNRPYEARQPEDTVLHPTEHALKDKETQ